MPTIFPQTPGVLVGGGVAGTDYDSWTDPTALSLVATDHAQQHDQENDAIQRMEMRVLALGPRTVIGTTTSVAGTGSGDQTLMSWSMPGVATTGWMTTRTLIRVYAAGTMDASASGLTYTVKFKIGSSLAAGTTLGAFTLNSGGTTTPGTPPQYEWEFEGNLTVNTVASPSAVQVRGASHFITDLTAASPSSTTHDHTVHLDRANGALVTFDNTATALIGLTAAVPAGGTPANNLVKILAGWISLESI